MQKTIIYHTLSRRILFLLDGSSYEGFKKEMHRLSTKKEPLWTKSFINITLMSLFIFLVFYILLTALPLFITEKLGTSADKAGWLLTVFLIFAIIVRPVAGDWISRFSQKKILIYSTTAFFVACLFYFFVHSFAVLLVVRAIHGIIFGIITTVKGAVSAELIPMTRRAEGLSYYSMAMGLAMVLGPVIGLQFASASSYNAMFVICAVLSVFNILLAMIITIPGDNADKHAQKGKFSFSNIVDPRTVPYAAMTFISAIAYSSISAFLSLYAKELDLVIAASYFFIVYAVCMLLCRPFVGKAADQYGPKYIIFSCLAIFAIGLFVLQMTTAGWMLIVAGAIMGIGYGSITPIYQTEVMSSVPPERVGVASSVFFNSMDLGMAVGAAVMGIIAGASSYSTMYLTACIIIVVAFFLYMYVSRKGRRYQQ